MDNKYILTCENRKGTGDNPPLYGLFVNRQMTYKFLENPPHSNVADESRPSFRPFGITFNNGKVYVGSHENLLDNEGNIITLPNSVNTHQVIYKGNCVFYTNTSNDIVGYLNTTNIGDRWLLDVKTMEFKDHCKIVNDWKSNDTLHVNSLCLVDNFLFFTLHNFNDGSKFYKINLETKEITFIIQVGEQCHSVEYVDGYIYTLSSGTGEFIIINCTSGEVKRKKLVNSVFHYLRGLSIDGRIAHIGISNIKEPNASVLELDFDSMEVIALTEIEGYDAILDIRRAPNNTTF